MDLGYYLTYFYSKNQTGLTQLTNHMLSTGHAYERPITAGIMCLNFHSDDPNECDSGTNYKT